MYVGKLYISTDDGEIMAIGKEYGANIIVRPPKLCTKEALRVYHLIAKSEYGLMVQIIAGLITYLLLAIYCHEQHNEKVSIKRVRELRIKIQNEARSAENGTHEKNSISHAIPRVYAKT